VIGGSPAAACASVGSASLRLALRARCFARSAPGAPRPPRPPPVRLTRRCPAQSWAGALFAGRGLPVRGAAIVRARGSGSWEPDLGTGIWEPGSGNRDLGTGIWEPGFGNRDLGTGIWEPGFGNPGSGNRDLGTGIWEPGVRVRDPGSGFRFRGGKHTRAPPIPSFPRMRESRLPIARALRLIRCRIVRHSGKAAMVPFPGPRGTRTGTRLRSRERAPRGFAAGELHPQARTFRAGLRPSRPAANT
jgi:hypothetical protein